MTRGVPMRCDTCGLEFQGADSIDLGPGVTIMIDGNRQSCPRPGCSGYGRQLVDGAFSADEEGRWQLVRALRPPGVTLGDYERALEAIRAGQERGASPNEIAQEVAAAAPRLAPLAAFIQKHGGLFAILSLLVTIVGVIRDFADTGSDPAPAPNVTVDQRLIVDVPPLSETQVRRLIDEELDRRWPSAEQESSRSHEPGHRAGRTPGPNRPCPCQSGRKYKHCHGSGTG